MWRLTFHIWPHASHRQYVDALIFSFGIEILADRQNGQTVGGASSSGSVGFTRSSPDHDTPLRMPHTGHVHNCTSGRGPPMPPDRRGTG
jgi:hypothetical protein